MMEARLPRPVMAKEQARYWNGRRAMMAARSMRAGQKAALKQLQLALPRRVSKHANAGTPESFNKKFKRRRLKRAPLISGLRA